MDPSRAPQSISPMPAGLTKTQILLYSSSEAETGHIKGNKHEKRSAAECGSESRGAVQKRAKDTENIPCVPAETQLQP